MKKIFEVALRDYLATVRTKTFLIGLLLLPVMIAVGMVVPGLLMKKSLEGPREDIRLAVINLAQELSADLEQAFAGQNESNPERRIVLDLREVETGQLENESEELKDLVRSGKLDAFLFVEKEVVEGEGRMQLYTKGMTDFVFPSEVKRLLNRSISKRRYLLNNLSPELIDRLGRWVPMEELDLGADTEKTRNQMATTMVPFFFMFLMFMGIMTTSQGLMMSVIEEKSSRVIEVLLSALSPFQLMTGKILGQTAVGLTLLILYVSGGFLVAVKYGMADLLTGGMLAYFIVYFLLGFLLISSMLAAIGSICNDVKESQNLMMPIMMILMVPIFVWIFIVQRPEDTLAVVLSFIPPMTPMVMVLRLAVRPDLPLVQVIGSFLLLAVSVPAVMWAAGKIFRVGILMYGKPPSLKELLRWIRCA
jgi:ABC-2 type transport system permease protein